LIVNENNRVQRISENTERLTSEQNR